MSEGYIIGGGSSGGGTLTVTGVAGSTVTVSKDGKTRTRTLDSAGEATFKGLASGTWTLIMTNGSQTATRTVEITADYSISIAYFASTINVTYPAGSTCTATDGSTTLTAPDTTGTWACVVPNAATWTVTATDGDKTKSAPVSITAEGQTESVTLSYTLYLLQNGVKKVEFSQGTYAGTVTFSGTAIEMSGDTTSVWTTSKIDVSAYSRLKVTYRGGYDMVFGLSASVPTGASKPTLASVHASAASAMTTAQVDISAINQAVVVQIYSHLETAYIYSIWLE